jgi:alkanesulfonate monooxygenase SsuD/methylene tetrahydromethanopterin reductase-like flavin-dependent oxidoreductase (luciferase family)
VSCGLRDVVEFEGAGRPAVLIASDAFVQAADEQARKLGQTELRRMFVAHPIQDRTDEELQALAAGIVDDALAALTG